MYYLKSARNIFTANLNIFLTNFVFLFQFSQIFTPKRELINENVFVNLFVKIFMPEIYLLYLNFIPKVFV